MFVGKDDRKIVCKVLCDKHRGAKVKINEMNTNLITEEEVLNIINKKKTALWRLRKKYGFPAPVFTHLSRYNMAEVEKWILSGGVNRVG